MGLVDVLGLRPVGWQPGGGGPEDEGENPPQQCTSLLTPEQRGKILQGDKAL